MMQWNPAVGVPLLFLGIVALALIYVFGRPAKPRQGQRRERGPRGNGERVEPTLGPDAVSDRFDVDDGADRGLRPAPLHADLLPVRDAEPASPSLRSDLGSRPDQPIERIVTLFVAARSGETLAGADVVVAAEKAGLQFGDRGIFHRIAPGRASDGPVYSMANMVKPGHFDMSRLDDLHTPGLTLFMTLPGPLPALDAWDMMLPTAQRLAELLDAHVLDEGRNALGRQRIAHLRDELRAWDRQHERNAARSRW